jgi:DNA-binding transcriptional LysR family regulator
MDPRKLEHFLAVAEAGNFTRAAKALRVAQPSLSQSIKTLERDLKVTLFRRLPGGLELTAAGQELLAPASRALRALNDARETMNDLIQIRGGKLDIGAPSSLVTYPTAELVCRFTAKYPKVHISIRESSDSQQAAEWVENGRVEVTVFEMSQKAPALERHRLLAYELYAAFPPGTVLPGAIGEDDIHWDELAPHPLIALAPHTVSRRLIEEHGLGENVKIEVSHIDSAVELVKNGAGASVLVEPYALLAKDGGAVIARLIPGTSHEVGLGYRRGEVAPAVRAFVELSLNSPLAKR